MKKLLPLLIAASLLVSCHHVYYAPNTSNAPLLSQKGETRINALYTTGSDSEFGGGELQLAHAISQKVGIMVNGFSAGRSEDVTDYSGNGQHIEKGKGAYIEFAGGLFTTLDLKRRWVADVYGGLGLGGVKNEYGYGDQARNSITKFFIQPSIGYKSPHFEFAVVPKLSLVSWKVKSASIQSQDSDEARHEISAIRAKPSFFSFEPALLVRVGGENLKLQGGLSFSNSRPGDFFTGEGMIESTTASLGLSVHFGGRKK